MIALPGVECFAHLRDILCARIRFCDSEERLRIIADAERVNCLVSSEQHNSRMALHQRLEHKCSYTRVTKEEHRDKAKRDAIEERQTSSDTLLRMSRTRCTGCTGHDLLQHCLNVAD